MLEEGAEEVSDDEDGEVLMGRSMPLGWGKCIANDYSGWVASV